LNHEPDDADARRSRRELAAPGPPDLLLPARRLARLQRRLPSGPQGPRPDLPPVPR